MSTFAEIKLVVHKHIAQLAKHPGFIEASTGLEFRNDVPTDTKAIVVRVAAGSKTPPDFPKKLDGVPVQVVPIPPKIGGSPEIENATPDEAEALAKMAPAASAEALSPYQPPQNLETLLNQPVADQMKVTCHVSPDCGWPTLKPFLTGAQTTLTIAMYDFTAPHIEQAMLSVGPTLPEGVDLILDPKISLDDGAKADDLQETTVRDNLTTAIGSKFDFVWAAVKDKGKTTAGIFPSAYHIKVAVRDHNAFWLSSGNWQSSNQPNLGPLKGTDTDSSVFQKFNREWHVIVEHPGLADLYEKFIRFDIADARPFQVVPSLAASPDAGPVGNIVEPFAAPQFFDPQVFDETITVQPLLTPDNYLDHVRTLIQGATQTIDIQNQYINLPKSTATGLVTMLQDLLHQQQSGIKVRIILRDIGDTRSMIEALAGFGFAPGTVRLQTNCHNKGIIIDGNTVVVGSHNWSSAGVEQNRDASLIFRHPGIANYFGTIFQNDWDNHSKLASAPVDNLSATQPLMRRFEDGAPVA